MARHCHDCERPLKPHEQGALCSTCFYGYICQPALDTVEDPPAADRETSSKVLKRRGDG